MEGDEGGVVTEGSAPPPLLCCETVEGAIPHALERLLDSASCQKPSDCLMLAIHLMLLETGFIPQVRVHLTLTCSPLREPVRSFQSNPNLHLHVKYFS